MRKPGRFLVSIQFSRHGTWLCEKDLVEDAVKGDLSKEEYPHVKEPSGPMPTTQATDPNTQHTPGKNAAIHSRRTNRPTGSTWANKKFKVVLSSTLSIPFDSLQFDYSPF